jgi:hypothetical protein
MIVYGPHIQYRILQFRAVIGNIRSLVECAYALLQIYDSSNTVVFHLIHTLHLELLFSYLEISECVTIMFLAGYLESAASISC